MTARRFLALAGQDAPDLVSAKIDGLRKFILFYGAARSFLWLLYGAQMDAGLLGLSAFVMSGCALLAWLPRYAHWGPRIAVPALLVQFVASFPFADNHFVLEILIVAVLAVIGAGEEDENLALQGVMWVTAVVLFQTGFQKVLYGQYFQGEFLAFMVGRGGRFGEVFAWMLPTSDVERLAAYDPLRSGAGPYRVDSMAFVAVSNLVYVAEMVLAALLFLRPVRPIAAVFAVLLVVVLQLGAREVGFALLFSSLLLSFFESALVRRLLPVAMAFLVWVVLAAAGVLPGGDLIDPGWM